MIGWNKCSLTQNATDAVLITWEVHHATQKRGKPFKVGILSLLPLIGDQAHSVATFKHATEKIRDTVAFLNPGQTPALAADQPLYALAKQIQWQSYTDSLVVAGSNLMLVIMLFKLLFNTL